MKANKRATRSKTKNSSHTFQELTALGRKHYAVPIRGQSIMNPPPAPPESPPGPAPPPQNEVVDVSPGTDRDPKDRNDVNRSMDGSENSVASVPGTPGNSWDHDITVVPNDHPFPFLLNPTEGEAFIYIERANIPEIARSKDCLVLYLQEIEKHYGIEACEHIINENKDLIKSIHDGSYKRLEKPKHFKPPQPASFAQNNNSRAHANEPHAHYSGNNRGNIETAQNMHNRALQRNNAKANDPKSFNRRSAPQSQPNEPSTDNQNTNIYQPPRSSRRDTFEQRRMTNDTNRPHAQTAQGHQTSLAYAQQHMPPLEVPEPFETTMPLFEYEKVYDGPDPVYDPDLSMIATDGSRNTLQNQAPPVDHIQTQNHEYNAMNGTSRWINTQSTFQNPPPAIPRFPQQPNPFLIPTRPIQNQYFHSTQQAQAYVPYPSQYQTQYPQQTCNPAPQAQPTPQPSYRQYLKNLEPPTFSGNTDLQSPYDFIQNLLKFKNGTKIPDNDMISGIIPWALTGEAYSWFLTEHELFAFQSMSDFVERFRRHFLSQNYISDLRNELERRTQGENEPLASYLSKILEYYRRLNKRFDDSEIIHRIFAGLNPTYAPYFRNPSQFLSLYEFKHEAELIDAQIARIRSYRPPSRYSVEPDLMPSQSMRHRENRELSLNTHFRESMRLNDREPYNRSYDRRSTSPFLRSNPYERSFNTSGERTSNFSYQNTRQPSYERRSDYSFQNPRFPSKERRSEPSYQNPRFSSNERRPENSFSNSRFPSNERRPPNFQPNQTFSTRQRDPPFSGRDRSNPDEHRDNRRVDFADRRSTDRNENRYSRTNSNDNRARQPQTGSENTSQVANTNPRGRSTTPYRGERSQSNERTVSCYNCSGNHYANECPHKKQFSGNGQNPSHTRQ